MVQGKKHSNNHRYQIIEQALNFIVWMACQHLMENVAVSGNTSLGRLRSIVVVCVLNDIAPRSVWVSRGSLEGEILTSLSKHE